ncbi:MAG: DUF2474 family protein [Proteobacteria bacterium]|nr:DUF2474 family protein [Pseudomonadota bacterium]
MGKSWQQFPWFVAIWPMSVSALLIVALLIREVLKR